MSEVKPEMKFTPKIHTADALHSKLTAEEAKALHAEMTIAPEDTPLGWNPYDCDTLGDLLYMAKGIPGKDNKISQSAYKALRRYSRAFAQYRGQLEFFFGNPPPTPRRLKENPKLEYARAHVKTCEENLERAKARLAELEAEDQQRTNAAADWIDPRITELRRQRMELALQLEQLTDELEAPIDEHVNLQTLIHLNKM